jgi:hypothetical protein
MLWRNRSWLLAALAAFWTTSAAFCEEPPVADTTPAAAAEVTPAQIAEWIKQLDADEFTTRQAAQQKLEDAGGAAIEALREAALGKPVEAAARAVDILQNHLRGDNRDLKAAAEATLKKIAESDNATAAGRAKSALQPEPAKPADPPQQNTPFGRRPIPVPIGGIGGGIRIEAHAIAVGGKGRRMSVKTVDGNKDIEVEEDGRKVSINETAAGKIKMSVTEKNKEGKEETKKYEAESADDLKKIHPDAHKIYEQYSKGVGVGVGGGRIEIRGIEGRAIPLPRVLPGPAPDVEKPDAKRLDEIRKKLEAVREVRPLEARPDVQERLKQSIKQLEEVNRQLEANAAIPADAREKLKAHLEELKRQLDETSKKVEDAEPAPEPMKE